MPKTFVPRQQRPDRDADNPYRAKEHRAALQKPKPATCRPMGKSWERRFIASRECANAGYGTVDKGCYDFMYKQKGRREDAHAEHVAAQLTRIHAERAAVAEAA